MNNFIKELGKLLLFFIMRYHYEPPKRYFANYGKLHICNHPVYSRCTLYFERGVGLAVVQQRFNPDTKSTYWSEIDPWLNDALYFNDGFRDYFYTHSAKSNDGIFPTVPIRKLMWALRMKPLPKERWETTFDRNFL